MDADELTDHAVFLALVFLLVAIFGGAIIVMF